jgi:predicted nuclease of predicted toxin-antitoxin system
MKILVDENIPLMTVAWLRELTHDVRDVRGTKEQGLEDPDLWTRALAESRMLITTDRGFSEYRGSEHHGILIVRLRQPNRLKIHRAVLIGMQRFSDRDWPGMLVVVRDATVSVSRGGGSVTRIS